MHTRRAFLLTPVLSVLARSAEHSGSLPAQATRTRILLGGDVMLSRYVGSRARRLHDPALPLRDLAPLLSSANIAFANLEAPFSDHGHAIEKGMVFKAEPEMVDALKVAGISVVSTANNHARDCGAYGVDFTIDWLAKNGIAAAGTGHTAEAAHQGAVLTRNGVRFGFLAYTYDQSNGNYQDRDDRIAMLDAPQMTRDVEAMLKRADVVIVSMHAGIEYQPKPNVQQRNFAHAAIDAGASVVVGAHPHVTQPAEPYKGGVIFYSLGNLVFDQFQRRETQHGLLADVYFAGAKLERWSLIPVDILQSGPRVAPTVPRP